MFERNIEFIASEDYLKIEEDKNIYPVPIRLNIPEWYKKIEHNEVNRTIKGCMPFLDTLTTGYLLKLPIDIYIEHNFKNDKGNQDSAYRISLGDWGHSLFNKMININHHNNTNIHPSAQLNGSPYIKQNKEMPFYKILNPWIIKTPPGYSCLFVPPLNNGDDRFFIMSGIVDTDKFENEINFPIVINGDKYPELKTTLKKGTPYVQIIPFKREKWKMSIKTQTSDENLISRIKYDNMSLFRKYQNFLWNKKEYK
jgi:hypothetical protein